MKENTLLLILIIAILASFGGGIYVGRLFPKETYTVDMLEKCKRDGGSFSMHEKWFTEGEYLVDCEIRGKDLWDKTINP